MVNMTIALSSTARSRRMRTCGMSTRAMRRRTTLQRACLVSNRKRPRMRRGAGTPPPCVASAAEAAAELHVAPRALELSVPGRFATLRVRLPAPVVDGEAKAKWKRAEFKLVVSMPLAGQ